MTKYDVERGLREIAEARRKERSDFVLAETAKLARVIADGFRREFDDELDMEHVGMALVIAAASLPPLVTGETGLPGKAVMNLIAFAGEELVRTARARAAEADTDADGQLAELEQRLGVAVADPKWYEHTLHWRPIDGGAPVVIPLGEPWVLPGTDVRVGRFELSSREIPPPADDEQEWCAHPDCHDRVHIDSTHTDEHGRPFTGKPGDPYEWTEKPGV